MRSGRDALVDVLDRDRLHGNDHLIVAGDGSGKTS